MRRHILYFLSLLTIAPLVFSKNINTEENFPDPKFRAFIEKYMEISPGGSFSEEEAAAKKEVLDFGEKGIARLKGIEFFSGLYSLICRGNLLQELDITKNSNLRELNCSSNANIDNLDLSKNLLLQKLDCSRLSLTHLDLPPGGALIELNCGENYSIPTLDLSGHPMLERLSCEGTSKQYLDLRMNPHIKFLRCDSVQMDISHCYELEEFRYLGSIPELDLSNRKKLHTFHCAFSNGIQSLNLEGCTGLKELYIINTSLPLLDLSNLTGLLNVEIYGNENLVEVNFKGASALQNIKASRNNQLKRLDVRDLPNLSKIRCEFNGLEWIQFEDNPLLEYIECSANNLETLTIKDIPNLQTFCCSGNRIVDLELNNLPRLSSLCVDWNRLVQLDLTGFPNLGNLQCFRNDMHTLNLKGLTNLETLRCSYNRISELDIGQNKDMLDLDCSNNLLTDISSFLDFSNLRVLKVDNNLLDCSDLPDVKALLKELGEYFYPGFDFERGVQYLPQKGVNLTTCENNLPLWSVY